MKTWCLNNIRPSAISNLFMYLDLSDHRLFIHNDTDEDRGGSLCHLSRKIDCRNQFVLRAKPAVIEIV
jgi:hypothetical protein